MALNLPAPRKERLTKAPLELVVCQLRYELNPRATEAEVALAFHESLGGRAGAFPLIQPVNVMMQTFQLTLNAQPQPAVSEGRNLGGWNFQSSDGSWVVSLMPDHVGLQTTRYTTWEGDFQTRLHLVLDALAQHLSPALEQRLGLRYVDRIRELQIEAPADWRPYITAEFLGPAVHSELGTIVQAAQQQLVIDLGEGVTCGLRHGFLRDPSTPQFVDYILDFDIYREGGRSFDLGGIKVAADRFNVYALQLFQSVVTPKLLERLS